MHEDRPSPTSEETSRVHDRRQVEEFLRSTAFPTKSDEAGVIVSDISWRTSLLYRSRR